MIAQRQKMTTLLDHNARIRAIPVKRGSTPATLKSIKQIKVTLANTFRLLPANVDQCIKSNKDFKDLCFSMPMEGDLLATFGPHDKVLAAKVQRRQTRHIQAEAARREKVRSEETATPISVDRMSDSDNITLAGDDVASDASDADSSTAGADVDILTTTPRSHHCTTNGYQAQQAPTLQSDTKDLCNLKAWMALQKISG